LTSSSLSSNPTGFILGKWWLIYDQRENRNSNENSIQTYVSKRLICTTIRFALAKDCTREFIRTAFTTRASGGALATSDETWVIWESR
jgi:hypothetical protein